MRMGGGVARRRVHVREEVAWRAAPPATIQSVHVWVLITTVGW
jgi:hypothetical protein